MNINILVFVTCVCLMFIIGKIFIVPIKWIFKLILNSLFGGLLIWIINLIGGICFFHIGLNVYTAVLVGILGIPGAILLALIQLLI